MKIIKITNNLFDAFTFDGWENWSRWSKDKSGYLKQIGGNPVEGFLKNLIIKKLSEVK